MDDAQLQRKLEQQRQLQEHLQNRQRVQLIFARYGGDTCRVIWEELRRHQGLHPVLQRLGLPAASSLDQEIELLQRFLNDQGPGAFMKRVRPHRSNLDWDVFETPDETAAWSETPAPLRQPAPAPPNGAAGAASTTRPEWFDPHGRYIGPERRSKSDRRTRPDRRAEIESISRNKRFGGDRRKNRGRRKTDPH